MEEHQKQPSTFDCSFQDQIGVNHQTCFATSGVNCAHTVVGALVQQLGQQMDEHIERMDAMVHDS